MSPDPERSGAPRPSPARALAPLRGSAARPPVARRPPSGAATGGAFAAALALALGACGEPERPHPVLVVGIDGLEPSVVAELLAAGRLPTLAGFVERGVVGRISSMVPTYSPVIWTTIATGQEPEAHGIDFFLDGEGRPYTSNARRVPALWNLVSDAGLTVDCVGWWNTWPAEPVNGRMLASYAAQAQASLIWKAGVWEGLEDQTWPPGLRAEIADSMLLQRDGEQVRERLFRRFPAPGELDDVLQKSVTDLAWTYAADVTAAQVTQRFLRQGAADLTLAYLALPDVAGHRFWRYREPGAYGYEVDPDGVRRFADWVALAHVEADRWLGEILAAAPPDANVLVLSDHGMHASDLDDAGSGTSGHHEDGPPGVFAARGPEVAERGDALADEPLGGVLEVAPLVLRLLGQAVPEHWPALRAPSPLERVLDPSWRRAHRTMTRPSPDGAFRPATPSRLPAADVDREFVRAFEGLGYFRGRDVGASATEAGQ